MPCLKLLHHSFIRLYTIKSMPTQKTNFLKKHTKKLIISASFVVICIAAVVIFYFYQQSRPSAADEGREAPREQAPSETLPSRVEDTGGADATETDDPIISDSGVISVYSPQKNTALRKDSVISGTATVDEVRYRIIDSERGVITTGALEVNDGTFSATIGELTHAGNEGEIRIFSLNPETQNEENHVNIPVRFTS